MKGLAITEDSIYIAHDKDLVQKDTKRLLFMRLNDQLGQLDIGSRIPDYLDEPISAALAKLLIDETTMLLGVFEPRIVVESVAVQVDSYGNIEGENEYMMTIVITSHMADQPDISEDMTIQKVYVV